MKKMVICTFLLALLAGPAMADFSGIYDHGLWTFEDSGGDGSASGTTSSLELLGCDVYIGGPVITTYTIKAPGDGTFSFDWSYICLDAPRYDSAGYIVDGSVYKVVQQSFQSGSVSVPVLEGQTIGFYVDSSSGTGGEGRLTVTNFSGPAASGAATGAACFLQPGCLDGLFESEVLRRNGTYMGDGLTCGDVDCGAEPPAASLVLAGGNIDLTSASGCSAVAPTLTYNTQSDEFLVVWEESSVASATAIGAQRVSATGTLLGSPVILDMSGAYQLGPTAAYNSTDDEYLLAWRSQSGWPDFNSTAGQRLGPDLTTLGLMYQLSGDGKGFESTVLHNPTVNEYFLSARGYDPEPGGIFGSRIQANVVLEQEIPIDTSYGISFSYPAPNGEVAYNSIDNQYLATWAVQGYPTWTCYNLRGQIINADGTMDGPYFEITAPGHFRTFYSAATVAFDPNEERYLVAFGETRMLKLQGQFVDTDGTLIGHAFDLSDPMVANEVAPHLAFDPVNNVYLLTWYEDPMGNPTQIFAQLLAADGTPLGDKVTLCATATFSRPFVHANPNSGGFLVVWRDIRNNPTSNDIYGQFIDVVVEDSTVAAELTCLPSSGTVPFGTQMSVTLENLYTEQTRRLAGHIDAQLANGTWIPSWRAGFTNVAAGSSFQSNWNVTIPALATVIGDNTFTLQLEDVTPAPYNQPPYPPAGDTATDACTVTGIAP